MFSCYDTPLPCNRDLTVILTAVARAVQYLRQRISPSSLPPRQKQVSSARSKAGLHPIISPSAKKMMVKFKIKAVHAALGVISPIQVRPSQGALWSLKLDLVDGLRKLKHTNHPSEGYFQYLCTNSDQGLISNIYFGIPKCMGEYFVIPDASFANTRQEIAC